MYDNAQANAVMQKAIVLITAWEGFSLKRKMVFLKYIENLGSPLVDAYDPDPVGDDELQKATIQIRVSNIEHNLSILVWCFFVTLLEGNIL